jgi:hypothetical protein
MKKNLLILFVAILTAGLSDAFAQRQGELDRFSGSVMTEQPNVVKLFPNPTDDYIQIEIKNSNLENPKITLYNIIGNEIILDVEEKEDNLYEIMVKDLPSGYYLIAIKDEQTFFRETYKFVKR